MYSVTPLRSPKLAFSRGLACTQVGLSVSGLIRGRIKTLVKRWAYLRDFTVFSAVRLSWFGLHKIYEME